VPQKVPTPNQLGIPPAFLKLLDQSSGLIMVVGRVGMGKSTLCASFLEYLNQRRGLHIVTLEDPIEFRIKPKKAVISQREMREHATSFQDALKAILRQSPDVIYVGELRDMETISATLSAAETGHLVLANLHTANSIQTIHRLVGMFPPSLRPLISVQLANCLTAVLCQCLVPRADGNGLVAAQELMLMSPAIANLIRKTELHQIQSVVDTSSANEVRKMEYSLAELYMQGVITLDTARANALEPDSLGSYIEYISKEALKKGVARR
jgi:twitching motility protein PilT